ncbi:polyhydroxyalkanoate synthesis regulator DNA-binding domain-containing protein [Bdellovibrionota bacterium FG-1]
MIEAKLIKRYQNRKLYDANESIYVTLDDVAKMIKNGADIKVIDHKTKNDLTAITLTQLLFERERKVEVQPSVDLLKEIIKHGDSSFSGYIQAKMATELVQFDGEQSQQPTMNQ